MQSLLNITSFCKICYICKIQSTDELHFVESTEQENKLWSISSNHSSHSNGICWRLYAHLSLPSSLFQSSHMPLCLSDGYCFHLFILWAVWEARTLLSRSPINIYSSEWPSLQPLHQVFLLLLTFVSAYNVPTFHAHSLKLPACRPSSDLYLRYQYFSYFFLACSIDQLFFSICIFYCLPSLPCPRPSDRCH